MPAFLQIQFDCSQEFKLDFKSLLLAIMATFTHDNLHLPYSAKNSNLT